MNPLDCLASLVVWPEHNFAPYLVAEGTEERRIKRQILNNIRQKQACAAVGGFDHDCGHAGLNHRHGKKNHEEDG